MVTPLVLVMFIVVGFVMSIGLKDVHIDADLSTEPLNGEQKKVLYLIGALIFVLLINAPIKPYYNGLGLSEPAILLAAGLLLFMPSNAIAMSSGVVSIKTMATYGIVFNILGILLIVTVSNTFWRQLL